MPEFQDLAFQIAVGEAKKALELDEVPVGAVVTRKDEIIAQAHNQIIARKDPTAHAERLAIEKASKILKNERLTGCSLYTTLEPCVMCTGAIILSRIESVYFLAFDEKLPALRKVLELKNHNHYPFFEHVLREDLEYENMLKNFFKSKRK